MSLIAPRINPIRPIEARILAMLLPEREYLPDARQLKAPLQL